MTPKSIAMSNLEVVHTACQKHPWESCLALVGSNIVPRGRGNMSILRQQCYCNTFFTFDLQYVISVKSHDICHYLIMQTDLHMYAWCLSWKIFTCFLISNIIIMQSLFSTHKNIILTMLDAGYSSHSIASATGIHPSTISRLHSKECSELQKSVGGHPSKLSSTNVHHAIYLITSHKAENVVQVTKTLSIIINQSLSPNTVLSTWKSLAWRLWSSENIPFSLPSIIRHIWTLPMLTRIGLSRTGRRLYGLIRLKSIA